MVNQQLVAEEPTQISIIITLDTGASYSGEARFIAEWFHIKAYWFKGFDGVFADDKAEISEEQYSALLKGNSVRVRLINLTDDNRDYPNKYDKYGCNASVHPNMHIESVACPYCDELVSVPLKSTSTIADVHRSEDALEANELYGIREAEKNNVPLEKVFVPYANSVYQPQICHVCKKFFFHRRRNREPITVCRC